MAHQRGNRGIPDSKAVTAELCPTGNALSHASWSLHCQVLRAAPEPPEAAWAEGRPLTRKSRLVSPGQAPGGSQPLWAQFLGWKKAGVIHSLQWHCGDEGTGSAGSRSHACPFPHTHTHIHTCMHMCTCTHARASPQLPQLSGEMTLKSPRRRWLVVSTQDLGRHLAVCPITPSFRPCHARGHSGDLRGRP